MDDNNKNPNEKQPGEKEPGTFHYNPGNMSGKTADSGDDSSQKESNTGSGRSGRKDQNRDSEA